VVSELIPPADLRAASWPDLFRPTTTLPQCGSHLRHCIPKITVPGRNHQPVFQHDRADGIERDNNLQHALPPAHEDRKNAGDKTFNAGKAY
jgi:hypothetical protein